VILDEAVLFVLGSGDKAYIFLHRDGGTRILADMPSVQGLSSAVAYRDGTRALFIVKTHRTYERGDNPVFLYDGARLARVTDYPEVYDVDVDAGARHVAFCHWEGEDRHIAIRALKGIPPVKP
jgi:hypothetical protein